MLTGCTGKGTDLVFVLDGSGSIGSTNFIKVKNFVVGIVSEFDIAPNMTQVGVVKYSEDVKEVFKLNTYETKAEVRILKKYLGCLNNTVVLFCTIALD